MSLGASVEICSRVGGFNLPGLNTTSTLPVVSNGDCSCSLSESLVVDVIDVRFSRYLSP